MLRKILVLLFLNVYKEKPLFFSMGREVSDKNILDWFALRFCCVVEKYSKYAIVSGFLVISSGRARGTEDVDIIIEQLSKERFKEFHTALVAQQFVCMQSSDPEEI